MSVVELMAFVALNNVNDSVKILQAHIYYMSLLVVMPQWKMPQKLPASLVKLLFTNTL